MPKHLIEEAERLLGYWDIHGSDPEVVARWAVTDLIGFLGEVLAEVES